MRMIATLDSDTALPSSPQSAPQSPERYTVWYDRASQPA